MPSKAYPPMQVCILIECPGDTLWLRNEAKSLVRAIALHFTMPTGSVPLLAPRGSGWDRPSALPAGGIMTLGEVSRVWREA